MTLAPQSTTVERPLRPLEDPSGRRLRWMRLVGRAIALLLLLWFVALVLGALGVAPHGRSLFGRALGPRSDQPPLAQAPAPPRLAATDLVAVLPEAAAPVPVVQRSSVPTPEATARTHGNSASAPGQSTATTTTTTATTPVATTHGRSSTAPGHTTTTHGRSSTAPGQTKTTTPTPGNGHAYGHNSAKTH